MNQRSKLTPLPAPSDQTRYVYSQWRASFVTPLLMVTLIIGLFVLIPAVISSTNAYMTAVFIAAYLAVGIITFSKLSYQVRVSVFLLIIYVLGMVELIFTGILGDGLFFFIVFIMFATMMFSPRAGMAVATIVLLTFIVMGSLFLSGIVTAVNPAALEAKLTEWLTATLLTLLFGGAIIYGFRNLELAFSDAQRKIDRSVEDLKNERNNLEKNVAGRTRQLQQINEISRVISSILDLDELLPQVVHLIGQEFDCYYTAVFLLDNTGQWVELKEATGDAGRTLRDNKYRQDASGKGLVPTAIQLRQPCFALDTGDDPVKFDNPLLRYTRSEAALPLIVGEHVIGALDLQSTKGSAFAKQDMDAFQNMANQVAIAMDNARLFQEASRSLADLRATQREYVRGAWSDFSSEQQLEYRLGDAEVTELTRELEVPLALRDQIIGQINMSMNEEWTPEQKSLIESIATQAALALENARLVEESQVTAARERLANEIIAKIWSSTSMDGILQTSIRELGRAFDATEAVIEINLEEGHE